MNGHRLDGYTNGPKNPGAASLCNLGNTCFLNSVLYTLRFTPGFCHNLHHLHHDIAVEDNSAAAAAAAGAKGKKSPNGRQQQQQQDEESSDQELFTDVIDNLHLLFRALSAADDCRTEVREPIQPTSLLYSIGKLCPMFEGNQQQDAHELLVTLLNTLQDVKFPPKERPAGLQPASSPDGRTTEKAKLLKKRNKSSSASALNNSKSNGSIPVSDQNGVGRPESRQEGEVGRISFIKEGFVGKSVMKTRCLECETSSFRSETFTNIDIPVHVEGEEDPSTVSFFMGQIMATETLRDVNKYWCSECSRLNEAQRSVHYEQLPPILVIQLKRFTTTGTKAHASKITDFVPTPFELDCFCVECRELPESGRPRHRYQLYAVILHLGATLASGHYIAYVRAGDTSVDYFQCQRASPSARPEGAAVKQHKKGLLGKMFSRSSSVSSTEPPAVAGVEPVCNSLACCGLRVSGTMLDHRDTVHHHGGGGGYEGSNGEVGAYDDMDGGGANDDLWLECDDEQISVLSRRQFEGILTAKQSATTPYLLFYHRTQ